MDCIAPASFTHTRLRGTVRPRPPLEPGLRKSRQRGLSPGWWCWRTVGLALLRGGATSGLVLTAGVGTPKWIALRPDTHRFGGLSVPVRLQNLHGESPRAVAKWPPVDRSGPPCPPLGHTC